MAAIASSQLHSAGFGLEPGVVAEPFTALSGKLTDPQAKLLADIVAWLFPSHGFRLQAIVFDLPRGSGTRVYLIGWGGMLLGRAIGPRPWTEPPGRALLVALLQSTSAKASGPR